ncbi:peptidoglycan-binding domain-containing protein [Microcoleus sp. FACHB-672]|uniref:peptidoglycan-binding domain-containing protein n=1 Tax=Microcoleus sp. FACHB-672 TaxID=2692825 RepID=UPI001685AABD|nr:peptidoglycan-binding protein [Microcoleus sp. FACHB-672]MBD2040633.1 peptidoglycan-binding protein [Microcoleus sp. FACHB-672]
MLSTNQDNSVKASISKPQLQLGYEGTAVMELQKLLKRWGAYRQPITGIFDKTVEFAVKMFQFSVFLPEDGVVGSFTWQALATGTPVNMPVLEQGRSGQAVKTMQQVLWLTGHYNGVVDGNFGFLTYKAVCAFQKSFGLAVDGIVGQQTWNALSQVPRGYNPN